MARNDALFVLIVRDAGLRSTLVARLSLAGADLITAANLHDPAIERRARKGAALVLDHEAMREEPAEWIDALQDQNRWSHVVVLIEEHPEAPGAHDRLIYVEKRDAAVELLRLLEHWRRGN